MTGWIYPHWLSNDTLLRSFSGAVFNDDAVITPLGGAVDPWFFDDQQGLGVDDVELSRDLSTVVGIAGFNDEKLRVYRTLMSPFGAPDWNHQPFYTGNTPVAERCYELDGKFESTTLAPGGGAMAYGTAEGVYVAEHPRRLRARRPRHAAGRRRALPGLGPGRRPAGERLRDGDPRSRA